MTFLCALNNIIIDSLYIHVATQQATFSSRLISLCSRLPSIVPSHLGPNESSEQLVVQVEKPSIAVAKILPCR